LAERSQAKNLISAETAKSILVSNMTLIGYPKSSLHSVWAYLRRSTPADALRNSGKFHGHHPSLLVEAGWPTSAALPASGGW
jgi:hypothetical protein